MLGRGEKYEVNFSYCVLKQWGAWEWEW